MLSMFPFLQSEAKQGFFFKISATTSLVLTIVFLNSSSDVSYMLQSDAGRSTPLSSFLTANYQCFYKVIFIET